MLYNCMPLSPQFLTRWVSRLLGWLWYPGLSHVLVSIAFPIAFHISMFSIHSSPAIGFHSCFHLRPTYLHPFGRPFTYSLLRWVSRLRTGSGIRCCGPRGGTGVCME